MIITIEGKKDKTNLVKTILKKNKALFINESDIKNKSWLLDIDNSIDFLVVKKVTKIKRLKLLLTNNVFKVKKPYSEIGIIIKLPPNIILIR